MVVRSEENRSKRGAGEQRRMKREGRREKGEGTGEGTEALGGSKKGVTRCRSKVQVLRRLFRERKMRLLRRPSRRKKARLDRILLALNLASRLPLPLHDRECEPVSFRLLASTRAVSRLGDSRVNSLARMLRTLFFNASTRSDAIRRSQALFFNSPPPPSASSFSDPNSRERMKGSLVDFDGQRARVDVVRLE